MDKNRKDSRHELRLATMRAQFIHACHVWCERTVRHRYTIKHKHLPLDHLITVYVINHCRDKAILYRLLSAVD